MPDGLPTPRRYLAILSMSFGLALIVIDGSIVSVALPTIARDLGVAPSAAVSIVTIYQLVLVMTLLPFSALGTRIGLRRLYQYGQILFCIASALCFFAKSLPFLLVTRAAQALGAAAALSVTSALVRTIYPRDRLGRARARARRGLARVRSLAMDFCGERTVRAALDRSRPHDLARSRAA